MSFDAIGGFAEKWGGASYKSSKGYAVALVIALHAFVLTSYRPVGLLAFIPLSAAFAWIVANRAKEIDQVWQGRLGATCWIVGWLLFHLFVINMQFVVLPRYVALMIGGPGMFTFAAGVLFSAMLIKQPEVMK